MRTSLKPTRNFICIGLALVLIAPLETLSAQVPAPPPSALNLVVVEGQGATNNIRQRASRSPVVRVEDNNHKPIAAAVVVFTLPTEGATGEFPGGSKSATVTTDSMGLAKSPGLKLAGLGGKLPIHVSASYRGLTARTTIMQLIEVPPGAKPGNSSGSGKLIAILAVVGAAAAGGALYATHKSSTSTAPPVTIPSGPTPIGISVGSGTIAPPH